MRAIVGTVVALLALYVLIYGAVLAFVIWVIVTVLRAMGVL